MSALAQPAVLGALAVGSVALFVASLIGVPVFIARMPPDYFSRRERRRLGLSRPPLSALHLAGRIAKNLLGLLLLVAGLVMLLAPGQGLLTIIVALLFLDFPGKRPLQRRIVASPRVLRALNALRRRAGRPPLQRAALNHDQPHAG